MPRGILVKSAEFGHGHCVTVLVEAKANVHAANDQGATALYFAAQHGLVEMVKYLHSCAGEKLLMTTDKVSVLAVVPEKSFFQLRRHSRIICCSFVCT